MAKQTTRKRGLPQAERGSKVTANQDLAARLRADRVRRRMTWPAYAQFMGMQLSTIYKIASGATKKPHELTVAELEAKLAGTSNTAEGAADAVVSSGQRHPERPED